MKDESNIDLELMTIRSMLADNSSFLSVAAVNPPEDIFSNPENRTIYSEAMNCFLNTGNAPTYQMVYQNLVISGKYPRLNEYFKKLLNVSDAGNTGYMIKLLTEKTIEREIRSYIQNAPKKGLDFAMDLSDSINNILQKYIGGCVRKVRNIDVAEAVLKDVHNAMEGKFNNYIPTLIPGLDKQIIGIPKKHVTVIAARPGMGKTDLMLQLMRNFMKQNLNPCVFSLEMDAQGLLVRNISEAANIDSMKIENGELNEAEFKMLIEAAKKFAIDDYLIDDNAVETAEVIKAKINYWRLRHNVGVIMIDYMTLIKTNYKQERYDLEIGSLVRDLREFAKKTEIPIIILSQLNRDAERRQDHKPQISDLRESGSIEQEASLVMLIYRPDEYDIEPFEKSQYYFYDSFGNPLKADEYMEIHVAKARSAKTGLVPVRYIPAVHRIESVKAVKKTAP